MRLDLAAENQAAHWTGLEGAAVVPASHPSAAHAAIADFSAWLRPAQHQLEVEVLEAYDETEATVAVGFADPESDVARNWDTENEEAEPVADDPSFRERDSVSDSVDCIPVLWGFGRAGFDDFH